MALAKKCDLCGDYYEPYNTAKHAENVNGIAYFNIDADRKSWTRHIVIDCCPKCMESIKNHINSLKRKGD